MTLGTPTRRQLLHHHVIDVKERLARSLGRVDALLAHDRFLGRLEVRRDELVVLGLASTRAVRLLRLAGGVLLTRRHLRK